ncbi:hypothetical protein DVJ83_17880 (plasmid) [Deinococcus wulumuqiensis]|uniref:Uncharacterized protein n=1 Tax=Deinococcus wulumuqiensis TaxID=980427 RepID=A0A345IMP6_9DEIO|nr:hypothetical protein [Deinococcus wulumuqiensis]AXH00969.1 hypothetical protein DVJ83_17880 [Deinococcus wulumuqiensis]
MRLITYQEGCEVRVAELRGLDYIVWTAAGQQISTGRLAQVPELPGDVLLALHQQDPALSIPDGVQVWQVRNVQSFGSLLAAQQARFPDAYALMAVIPTNDLDLAFGRAQHGFFRDPEAGVIEDGLDWRDREGVWKRPGRAVSSSPGDVYVTGGAAYRVLGVGFERIAP